MNLFYIILVVAAIIVVYMKLEHPTEKNHYLYYAIGVIVSALIVGVILHFAF